MIFDETDKKEFQTRIGASLRKARLELQVSQKKVCKKMNISQPQLSKIERGLKDFDVILLAEFAILYKKKLTHFIPEILLNKYV